MDAGTLLEAVPDPLIAFDAEARIVGLNPAAEALLGWRSGELAGAPLTQVLPQQAAGRVSCVRKGGTLIEVELSISPDGPLRAALLRPLREEPAPRGSEAERYRLVFENAPIGILHFDARGVVTACNGAMEQMLGSSKRLLVGVNLLTLQGDATRGRIAQLIGETIRGDRARYEGPYRSVTSGKTIEVTAVIEPIHDPAGQVLGGVLIALDITERKQIQAQLARADRMASIGTLAAGVAHEINNPLVYVTLGLELIERELSRLRAGKAAPEDWDRLQAYCKDALEGAERVRSIVRDLHIFSRPAEERAGPVEVEKVLESSLNMAMSHIRSRARLERVYGPVPRVMGDESRLGQVFLNLLVNAAQAIPEGAPDQHRIVLRTFTGGTGVAVVEVEDTGVGIEPWKLERIFEPFWTDKPVGVGTGLGLSIVHAIVSGLGGAITVRSRPGHGSTFRVSLPAFAPPAPAPKEPPPSFPAGAPRPAGGHRRARVLLIDDELNLGTTLATGLRETAEVLAVRSGEEAVRLLRNDSAFDLILCDLALPDLGGMEVYQQALRDRPQLRDRFVFITGGATSEREREFLEQVPGQRLDKPFRLEQVEALLRRG